MKTIRMSQRVLCAVVAILCLALNVNSQEYFLDDFEDGDVEDGMPVTWIPGTPEFAEFGAPGLGGHRELVDGDWVWTTPGGNNQFMGATVDEYTYEDVSLHAQFSISGDGGLGVRACEGEYLVFIRDDGSIVLWSTELYRREGGGGAGRGWGGYVTDLDPVNHDIHMQFDVFNNGHGVELSATAWHDGDARPAVPQAMTNCDWTCAGRPGLYLSIWEGDATPTAEFRFFEARPLSGPDVTEMELISSGQDWSFFPGTVEPSQFPEPAWTTPGFDDGQWDTRQEGFGYGPDIDTRDIVTELDDMHDNYNTVYLRHPFDVEDPLAFSDLLLEIDYDDAFVAYINGSEVAGYNVKTTGSPQGFDARSAARRSVDGVSRFLIELDDFPELLQAGDDNVLAIQGINYRRSDEDFALSQIRLSALARTLQAGDADQDYDFDQLDLVQVLAAAKYLTGESATWGQGDWNGAPGGYADNPPEGNGVFDQIDIIAAVGTDLYMIGLYGAIRPDGQQGDAQSSIVYDAATGELAVDAPAGTELTSINIESASGIFTGQPAANLGGNFDRDSDTNVFKATFGTSFGSLSFGNVAQPGLAKEFLLGDLTVVGSLQDGGGLDEVDLIYIPEPSSALLAVLGILALTACGRRVTGIA